MGISRGKDAHYLWVPLVLANTCQCPRNGSCAALDCEPLAIRCSAVALVMKSATARPAQDAVHQRGHPINDAAVVRWRQLPIRGGPANRRLGVHDAKAKPSAARAL